MPEKTADVIFYLTQRELDTSLKLKNVIKNFLTCWNHMPNLNLNITTNDSQSEALELESFLSTELDSLELGSRLQNI